MSEVCGFWGDFKEREIKKNKKNLTHKKISIKTFLLLRKVVRKNKTSFFLGLFQDPPLETFILYTMAPRRFL